MRFASFVARTLTTASSVALLCTLCALPAAAAPVSSRASGPVCEAQPVGVRKLPRHPRSFGGPLKQRTSLRFGLTDPTARVRRSARTTFDTNQAAIQNDAPAARIDEHERQAPTLLLVGVLPHAAFDQPHSATFTPRSPRGPPTIA
jgi:hypothetical protein